MSQLLALVAATLGPEQTQGLCEEVRQGSAIKVKSQAFEDMRDGIPRGDHLPSWAKRDLRVLFEYVKANGPLELEDALFDIRFGFTLEDDWTANKDRDDVDTLWLLLKDLPDSHVEGNTRIHELLLEKGEGGGWYSPGTDDIGIGSKELSDRESFEDVMRHEVGHAVHEDQNDLIQPWLESKFAWQIFGRTDADIDAWVALMGGWGGVKVTARRQIRSYLRRALGPGSKWGPGPEPSPPSSHAWWKSGFGPRLAFEKTGPDWYLNFKAWHRAGGRAFFLNYWYRTFMAVDESTLRLVAKMPSSYAAMSHFEFFAELYALYYDLDDPKRDAIPTRVSTWLENNIGAPDARAAARSEGMGDHHASPKRQEGTQAREAHKREAAPLHRAVKTLRQSQRSVSMSWSPASTGAVERPCR